jgi:hypothetical protein
MSSKILDYHHAQKNVHCDKFNLLKMLCTKVYSFKSLFTLKSDIRMDVKSYKKS